MFNFNFNSAGRSLICSFTEDKKIVISNSGSEMKEIIAVIAREALEVSQTPVFKRRKASPLNPFQAEFLAPIIWRCLTGPLKEMSFVGNDINLPAWQKYKAASDLIEAICFLQGDEEQRVMLLDALSEFLSGLKDNEDPANVFSSIVNLTVKTEPHVKQMIEDRLLHFFHGELFNKKSIFKILAFLKIIKPQISEHMQIAMVQMLGDFIGQRALSPIVISKVLKRLSDLYLENPSDRLKKAILDTSCDILLQLRESQHIEPRSLSDFLICISNYVLPGHGTEANKAALGEILRYGRFPNLFDREQFLKKLLGGLLENQDNPQYLDNIAFILDCFLSNSSLGATDSCRNSYNGILNVLWSGINKFVNRQMNLASFQVCLLARDSFLNNIAVNVTDSSAGPVAEVFANDIIKASHVGMVNPECSDDLGFRALNALRHFINNPSSHQSAPSFQIIDILSRDEIFHESHFFRVTAADLIADLAKSGALSPDMYFVIINKMFEMAKRLSPQRQDHAEALTKLTDSLASLVDRPGMVDHARLAGIMVLLTAKFADQEAALRIGLAAKECVPNLQDSSRDELERLINILICKTARGSRPQLAQMFAGIFQEIVKNTEIEDDLLVDILKCFLSEFSGEQTSLVNKEQLLSSMNQFVRFCGFAPESGLCAAMEFNCFFIEAQVSWDLKKQLFPIWLKLSSDEELVTGFGPDGLLHEVVRRFSLAERKAFSIVFTKLVMESNINAERREHAWEQLMRLSFSELLEPEDRHVCLENFSNIFTSLSLDEGFCKSACELLLQGIVESEESSWRLYFIRLLLSLAENTTLPADTIAGSLCSAGVLALEKEDLQPMAKILIQRSKETLERLNGSCEKTALALFCAFNQNSLPRNELAQLTEMWFSLMKKRNPGCEGQACLLESLVSLHNNSPDAGFDKILERKAQKRPLNEEQRRVILRLLLDFHGMAVDSAGENRWLNALITFLNRDDLKMAFCGLTMHRIFDIIKNLEDVDRKTELVNAFIRAQLQHPPETEPLVFLTAIRLLEYGDVTLLRRLFGFLYKHPAAFPEQLHTAVMLLDNLCQENLSLGRKALAGEMLVSVARYALLLGDLPENFSPLCFALNRNLCLLIDRTRRFLPYESSYLLTEMFPVLQNFARVLQQTISKINVPAEAICALEVCCLEFRDKSPVGNRWKLDMGSFLRSALLMDVEQKNSFLEDFQWESLTDEFLFNLNLPDLEKNKIESFITYLLPHSAEASIPGRLDFMRQIIAGVIEHIRDYPEDAEWLLALLADGGSACVDRFGYFMDILQDFLQMFEHSSIQNLLRIAISSWKKQLLQLATVKLIYNHQGVAADQVNEPLEFADYMSLMLNFDCGLNRTTLSMKFRALVEHHGVLPADELIKIAFESVSANSMLMALGNDYLVRRLIMAPVIEREKAAEGHALCCLHRRLDGIKAQMDAAEDGLFDESLLAQWNDVKLAIDMEEQKIISSVINEEIAGELIKMGLLVDFSN